MLTVVCFKWSRLKGDNSLPRKIPKYTADHVNILHNMVWRNLMIPHRFVCVTDDAKGIDPRIEIVPLWDKCRNLGGCFNRLYVFSKDMKSILGDRFVCIDLDCVIIGDITGLFSRKEDFIINSYNPFPAKVFNDNQLYNGGLFMMSAGARDHVWTRFNPKVSPHQVTNSAMCIGTDQAWIRLSLGDKEKRFTEAEGVYEARAYGNKIPSNAKIMMFAGQRDPSLSNKKYVIDNWY